MEEECQKINLQTYLPLRLLNRYSVLSILSIYFSISSLIHYIFLGINSKNNTGESWYTIESISKYFGKSPRTISYWFKELEKLNLIKRMQLEINAPSHTYLQP